MEKVCRYCLLGTVDYRAAWEMQRRLALEVAEGGEDMLLLLEHPPTYTLGRRGCEANMLVPRSSLVSEGVAVCDVDRGGDITFHGPGQLVGYPIMNLRELGLGIREYLRAIEQTIITALTRYGIRAGRVEGYTGVWVEDEKIAAIGVKITAKRITQHGFAVNVDTDLSYFDKIIPCGIRDKGVTTLSRLTHGTIPMSGFSETIATAFGAVFGRRMERMAPDGLESRDWRDAAERRPH